MKNSKSLRNWLDDMNLSHPLLIATPSSPTEKTELINVMLIDESGSKPSVFGSSIGFMTLTKRAIIFDEY